VINFEDKLLVHKNSNPIIIGKNSDEFIISSDNNIIQELCDEFVVLDDDDFCLIDSELSFSYLNKVLKKTLKKNVNIKEIKTTTFMESEILEQKNLKNIFFDENLKNIYELVNKIKNCNKKIILSAAGTSFHACLFFHYKLLEYGILSQVILASEFENYLDIIDDDFLIIVFSQSGETGDLIRPLKILSQNCVEIVSVLNNRNSSIEYLSKSCVFLNCGEEISVASTKAFGFQIFIIEVISDLLKYNSLKKISKRINFISDNFEVEVDKIFKKVDEIIFNYDIDKVFFIGRNSLFPIALEGALKLKEVSYMHSEGFAGGELKHGSLALVDTKTLVFCLDNNSDILSNAIEIKTRGGIIIGLGTIQSTEFDDFIKTDDLIFMIIALQIIGLKYSLSLGLSPDKPRNLAKSVTVR